MNDHTPSQKRALERFERACESHDLHAIGCNRRDRAWLELALAYAECTRIGLGSALTRREHAIGATALASQRVPAPPFVAYHCTVDALPGSAGGEGRAIATNSDASKILVELADGSSRWFDRGNVKSLSTLKR